MTTRTTPWPHGTPNWVDLGADDVEAATSFYSGLFGWDFRSGGQDSGGYLLARIDGYAVAGIGPKQDAAAPNVWTTFIASDDVDATAKAIAQAGGLLLAPPFDVMESGRMAIAADNAGAVFGVWQAGEHIGAGRVNEHGALCWNELHTRDYDDARRFYADVFGYSYNDLSGHDFVYSTAKRAVDGEDVGGFHHDVELPGGLPNYWLSWFASRDVDSSTALAVELGAQVIAPVMDTPFGRMSIVSGPQGEVFGLITLPAS